MDGEEGGEGPKVTRGLQVTEVVIGRRDGSAREEPGPRGLAEEECDGMGNALIVPFWRNGASRRSQQKGHQFFRTGSKRVVEDNEILDVQGGDRDYGRLREGAVAVKPTAHPTGKTVRERSKRKWLRKWGLVQERVG